jgi:hypothetical protein
MAKKVTKTAAKQTKTTAKPAAKAKPATGKSAAKPNASRGTRRPPNNPTIPRKVLDSIAHDLNRVKTDLEAYAAHLRALDRKRLNGVGIKKLGFIQRAYDYALENPEFLPHYLTIEKWTEDHSIFLFLRSLFDLNRQNNDLLWNLVTEHADIDYTDSLDFYTPVKEASKRRVDGAESMHKDLETFFKKKKSTSLISAAPETKKEQLRDAKGIISGKKDGKFEAVNIKPKLTGGVHKVIDEKFTDTAKFTETESGESDEQSPLK